ncbi:MAG: deoxyribodipyrimidine photo-lyase [Propionibacteriales bacterium]|nr:deoxyribodipyrimidine photo-lyase [Propionibacteriales bacterium]
MTSVLWFRRDLRISDHPALNAAADAGPVLGLFVIDPLVWDQAGPVRRAWVAASLQALRDETGGHLVLRYGDPVAVLPAVAREIGAGTVHITRETTPFGLARDARVAAALDDAGLARVGTGTPYAVDPGSVRSQKGDPYQVFTPFSRGWREIGWEPPLPAPDVSWLDLPEDTAAEQALADALAEAPLTLPTAGTAAALERMTWFRNEAIGDYADLRDRPGVDGTSRMSPYLKIGSVHPRQLLAEVDPAGKFATEIAWREFYADVLWHRPASAWTDLRDLPLRYDDPTDLIEAWRQGRTGFPIVDAGMRQLLGEGWMHNRVRMITASFLTKDLHAWWPVGARHFLDHLIDGDVASNSHGWQWTAGTGTDASPYFRVFNPITQGLKFDSDGDYIRRWVPELAHLPGSAVHEPWKHPLGYEADYPRPVVDHAVERQVALERYAERGD